MLAKLDKWINDRWPLKEVWKSATEEEIPGGASYAYAFGSATLSLFILQIVTGIWQMFYYVPTTDHAYQSLSYLRLSVPFGWLVHGLHYWGASAMVVLLAVHLSRTFVWGAYKKPRELTWLIGVFLLLFTLAMSFTGAALPWDETGYWASEVGTSIAGTIPVIGTFAEQVLRGGAQMGQLTLSRFFILHVAVLPAILLGFIALHVVAFREKGSIGPWEESKRKRVGQFWPDQIFKDALVFSVILLVLIGLAAFLAPPFSGPADPIDTTFQPKPEWNFLFLYQAIKAFQGPWESVGTIGIPTALIVLLFGLPFFDKRRERNPLKRPLAMSVAAILAVGVITLTITGYYSHPNLQANPKKKTEAQSRAPSTDAAVSQGSNQKSASILPVVYSAGASGVQDTNQIALPLGVSAIQPPSEVGEPGAAADMIGNARHGKKLFDANCISCHGKDGRGGIPNPGSYLGTIPALNPVRSDIFSKDPAVFSGNLDRFIQNGAQVPGPSSSTGMPPMSMVAYGKTQSLTQPEISNIIAYIMHVNGVDRARIDDAGVAPKTFFFFSLAVFMVLWLILGAFRLVSVRRRTLLAEKLKER